MKKLLLLAVGILLCSSVEAQSLKDRQAQKEENDKIPEIAKKLEEGCGIAGVKITLDWESWKAVPEDKKTYAFAEYCDSGVDSLVSICADQIGKDAVKEKIKAVSCAYSASAGQVSVAIKEGVVTFSFDLSNMSYDAKAQLENVL